MKKGIRSLILAAVVSLLFACSGPGSPLDSDDTQSSDTLSAPADITASFTTVGEIAVQWSSVSDVLEYEIWRKDGNSDFAYLSASSSNSFADTSYSQDSSVQYAVRSVASGLSSPLSDPTESLTEWIRDVSASQLEYTNEIRVTWEKQAEAEEYIVYRAGSKTGALSEITRFTSSDQIISYDDIKTSGSGVEVNTPYFYQIRWVKSGTVYGASSPVHMGVYSHSIDLGEPTNDDITTLKADTGSTASGILYSFSDGDGGVVSDTDWYRYKAKTGDGVTVTIDKPDAFSDEELYIRFWYNDIWSDPVPISGTEHQEFFTIPDPASTQESATLYFKIYPVTGTTKNLIGDYSLTIGNEL